jgi:hypothetical protein
MVPDLHRAQARRRADVRGQVRHHPGERRRKAGARGQLVNGRHQLAGIALHAGHGLTVETAVYVEDHDLALSTARFER